MMGIKKAIVGTIILGCMHLCGSISYGANGVLVEAEIFSSKGGWNRLQNAPI